MDDLERLQSMFPSVDADVVAIIFREFGHDGELIGVGIYIRSQHHIGENMSTTMI